jgi:hypothetical protein
LQLRWSRGRECEEYGGSPLIGERDLPRIHLPGTTVNKAGTSALLVFSAQVKETLLEDPYSFRACNRDAVEAFTEIAQDGPLPL